jgi:hypothetical protein
LFSDPYPHAALYFLLLAPGLRFIVGVVVVVVVVIAVAAVVVVAVVVVVVAAWVQ